MECSENSRRSYCPWLDESPTSLRVNDSQRQPQQRVIPKKMKKLIDGDLAAVSGKGRSTKDRLKDKLRRRQESKDQKELQESQNKDVAVPTDAEHNPSKKKKRRKKSKKASALDKQEEKHEDTILVGSNGSVEVEESAKKLNELSSGQVDESLHGDTLMSQADKDNASQLKKITVSGHFGKRIAPEHYHNLVENLHKKLRRNLAVQICMSERKKLVENMKREIEMEKLTKRKQALGNDTNSYICRMSFTAALLRLEEQRATLLKHKAIKPRPDTATTVGQKSSTALILRSKVLSEGYLSSAGKLPAEYPMKACLSKLDPMSIKDVVFSPPSKEKREKHFIAACEKVYAFLKSFVPQGPTELNTQPSSLVKNILVFGKKNSQFRSMLSVTYNRIQHAQTMSNALQVQEKKPLMLYISLGCSELKNHFITIMIKAGNIRAIEAFLFEAMKLMKNETSTTGHKLVQWSDAPKGISRVQMGHNQLITICGDLKLHLPEFFDTLKTYGLTISLMKQRSRTGLELVKWSDVQNCISRNQMGHSQLITICSDLKLHLPEFFDTLKTYRLTISLMKQRSRTGLELVKWSDVQNCISRVQMGHSQLITICGDLKLNLPEFFDTMKTYGMKIPLVKQKFTSGVELVKWSDVQNCISRVQMGHSQLITICGDLKLNLPEFFDTMKTYRLTISLMKQRSRTGLELVKWSDVQNCISRVQMGHSQLITICGDLKLNLPEFFDTMKTYGMKIPLVKQKFTSGVELVKWSDVQNCISRVQMGHSQLITICGDLKLNLPEFFDTMKTYGMKIPLVKQKFTSGVELDQQSYTPNSVSKFQRGWSQFINLSCNMKTDSFEILNEMKTYRMASSSIKQASTTGLKLVKWPYDPNSVSKVQMGHSQLITVCGDLKLDLFVSLDAVTTYRSTGVAIPIQMSPPITGVIENRKALPKAFKTCWMADTFDPWSRKHEMESTVLRKENAFEVEKQWPKIKTKTKMDTNSTLGKRKLINLPSVVRIVDLASTKATIAFKNYFGEIQISVDFAELLKYANKIVEQHSLVTKVSVKLLSKSQQFIKIEIQKANKMTDKLFISISKKASFNSITQIRTAGKSIEPLKFKDLKRTNIRQNKISRLVKEDISKINGQDSRKDVELDIRKVNDYKKPTPDGGNLLHQTSAAYGRKEEKVSYNSNTERLTPTKVSYNSSTERLIPTKVSYNSSTERLTPTKVSYNSSTERLTPTKVSYNSSTERLTPTQKEKCLCDNDPGIETRIALERQTLVESIKKITATDAARKYIFRLHRQMLKNISSEQVVKQHAKLNTIILSRHNVSQKHELLKQKLQKNKSTERVRETKSPTVETVSINQENATRSQNHDEAPRQREEQSENTNIIDDLEQSHYGIRLCMFN